MVRLSNVPFCVRGIVGNLEKVNLINMKKLVSLSCYWELLAFDCCLLSFHSAY